jgi:hypothetical protein
MRYFVAILLLLVSFQASAELERQAMNIVCGPTEELISQLRDKYNESVTWSGREENGNVTTMWMNRDKTTFTIVKTSSDGRVSCAISAGKPEPDA